MRFWAKTQRGTGSASSGTMDARDRQLQTAASAMRAFGIEAVHSAC